MEGGLNDRMPGTDRPVTLTRRGRWEGGGGLGRIK